MVLPITRCCVVSSRRKNPSADNLIGVSTPGGGSCVSHDQHVQKTLKVTPAVHRITLRLDSVNVLAYIYG